MGCLLVWLESWRDLTGVSCYGCAVALWLSVQLCSSDDSVRFPLLLPAGSDWVYPVQGWWLECLLPAPSGHGVVASSKNLRPVE